MLYRLIKELGLILNAILFNNRQGMKFPKNLVCAMMVVMASGLCSRADDIYDNSGIANGYGFTMANGVQVGNEVSISPGSAWTLTNFTIQYYAPALTSDIGIEVRFYLNDSGTFTNGFQTPGTLFYDSGVFSAVPTGPNAGYGTVFYTSAGGDFSSPNATTPLTIALPSDFTFTITFTSISGSDLVELPLANNLTNAYSQTVGDYWLNDGSGNWALMTNAAPANFVVDFAGTVPEPSTFGLAAIGGLVLMGVNRLRRKR